MTVDERASALIRGERVLPPQASAADHSAAEPFARLEVAQQRHHVQLQLTQSSEG